MSKINVLLVETIGNFVGSKEMIIDEIQVVL